MGLLDHKVGPRPPPIPTRKKREIVYPIDHVEWRKPRKAGRVTKLKGAAYHGVKFERAWVDYMVNKGHEGFSAGEWLYFEDANGWGYCQPDGLLFNHKEVIIFECKLGFTYRKAYAEMSKLYKPLIKEYTGYPDNAIKCVQVCRHLKPSSKRTTVVHTLKEVMQCPKKQLTWRWSPSV